MWSPCLLARACVWPRCPQPWSAHKDVGPGGASFTQGVLPALLSYCPWRRPQHCSTTSSDSPVREGHPHRAGGAVCIVWDGPSRAASLIMHARCRNSLYLYTCTLPWAASDPRLQPTRRAPRTACRAQHVTAPAPTCRLQATQGRSVHAPPCTPAGGGRLPHPQHKTPQ